MSHRSRNTGGRIMATSSIFTNFVIDTPEKAKAFVGAMQRSREYMRSHRTPRPSHKARIVTDKKELKSIFNRINEKYK